MESADTKIVLGYRLSSSQSYMLALIDAYENEKKNYGFLFVKAIGIKELDGIAIMEKQSIQVLKYR